MFLSIQNSGAPTVLPSTLPFNHQKVFKGRHPTTFIDILLTMGTRMNHLTFIFRGFIKVMIHLSLLVAIENPHYFHDFPIGILQRPL